MAVSNKRQLQELAAGKAVNVRYVDMADDEEME